MNKIDIKELSLNQLIQWLHQYNIAPFRARQIFRWLYFHQVDDFGAMSDLSKDIRKLLPDHFTISRLEKERIETSIDGSQKFLFKLPDDFFIESVLIPEKNHSTLCISTQVGCAQGCRFCLTAQGGFSRNLTSGEIIAQVRDIAKECDPALPLTNIVLMGMGEPLANYDNVVKALETIMLNDYGLSFSHRKVTLSTSGLVPKIEQLGQDSNVNLAISLNAPDNDTRNRLMPINKAFPIEQLLAACQTYPLTRRQRITFEYILIKDVNDSADHAKKLIKLLRPLKAKINLIPFNESEGVEFKRPESHVIDHFQTILLENNYTVIVRESKGKDISAACGQLNARRIKDLKTNR